MRELLTGHRPRTDRESRSLDLLREQLERLPQPFDEHADPVHVTASAFVLDGAGSTALHLHKRLGLWLQPGGHIDPGEWPSDAAVREATEELGLEVDHPPGGPRLAQVDVHDGGRGHTHLDLEFVLLAASGGPFAPGDLESQQVRWVPLDRVAEWGDATVVSGATAAAACLEDG